MAKSKATEWLTEEKLIVLRGWARNGLTDEQIAHNMGINRTTLYEYKNKYPNIGNALKENKEVADIAVENALYNKALGGDTTAMIFWLKNRKPQDWRDRRDVGLVMDEEKTLTVKLADLSKEEE
jgi:predicted DNA-binding protein (UPF0251 family)